MARPKLLDLFCGAGGAAMGYHRAGFDVTGVDRLPMPRFPFRFIEADIESDWLPGLIAEFDAVHASPPCQAHTAMNAWNAGTTHPDLVPYTRELLRASGKPYVIENVPGAPLLSPVTLCGSMFEGLRVRRHRLFETNWLLCVPSCGTHRKVRTFGGGWSGDTDDGDPWTEWVSVVGKFAPLDAHGDAMGIWWMTGDELAQAIPPAYTEHIGRQLLAYL